MTIRRLHAVLVSVLIGSVLIFPVPGPAQSQPPAPPAPQQPAPPQQPTPPQQPAPPQQPTPPQPAPAQQKIKAVEVRGNRRIPAEQILAAVTHTKAGDALSEDNLREDIRAINDLGFFADVTARAEIEQDGVRVVFVVTENPVISEVIVEGNTVVSVDDIRRTLGVPTGEVLNLTRMREGVRALQKLYEDRGYVLARVTDTAIIPLEGAADEARLRVRIAEGTVEAVRFEGLKKTRLVTLQRHMQETIKGRVFNVTALNRDLQRLFDTGLFESIQARPEPGTDPDTAVVVITVKEAKTAQIGGGLGYSSRDGLIGFVEYRDQNWRGLGQTVALRAERSIQISQRVNYEVSFREPFFDKLHAALDLSLYSPSSIEKEYGSGGAVSSRFELNRTGAIISLSRLLDPVTTASLRLRSELTEITPLQIDPANPGSPVVPPSLLSPGRVVSFQLGATRDTRNDRYKPTRGERLTLSTEFAFKALGGDFGFTKHMVDYQRLFPVGRDSAFVGRVLLGAASGALPLQERFLLGGSSTVRSLPSGFARADSIVTVNAEYRFPLGTLIKQLGEIQGIVFVDAGSAPIQFNNTKVGYGVGIALSTPIGPIRLDFAFGPEGQQTWLSVGAPF